MSKEYCEKIISYLKYMCKTHHRLYSSKEGEELDLLRAMTLMVQALACASHYTTEIALRM